MFFTAEPVPGALAPCSLSPAEPPWHMAVKEESMYRKIREDAIK